MTLEAQKNYLLVLGLTSSPQKANTSSTFHSAASLQYSEKIVLQAGHIWGYTLIAESENKSPSDWG